MRPCKFETDDLREEIAEQVAQYIQSGKTVEQFAYLVKSDFNGQVEYKRNPDGTLRGSCNSHLFDK